MTYRKHGSDFVRLALLLPAIAVLAPLIIAASPLLILGAGVLWLICALHDLKRGYAIG